MKAPDRPPIDDAFVAAVRAVASWSRVTDPNAPVRPGSALTGAMARALFDVQMTSRHIDFAARELRSRGLGYYTIGSAGHEGNVAVAAALRPSDPAFLHYRSTAFFLQRAAQIGKDDGVRDVLAGMVAARDEPIAGGRHKVIGSRALNIPPQTSTIASHLPKAVGAAFLLERAHRLLGGADTPRDAVVLCSFGDASANHSTATGAVNAACRIAYQGLPVPIVFLCEDNGLGISVRTPAGWIEAAYGTRTELTYMSVDGRDLAAAYETACAAIRHARQRRRPVFLHMTMTRLMGHAGPDVELAYRTAEEIRASEACDPLVNTAQLLVKAGAMSPSEIEARYEAIRTSVTTTARLVSKSPKLSTAAEIAAPLAPRHPDRVAAEVGRPTDAERRNAFWGDRDPAMRGPTTLSVHLNAALGDLAVKYPGLLVFGEDVARKGGVYGVTRGLFARMGGARVFDTILDETTILGLAIAAGMHGLLPIPEIQYLAYLHNAEDQLRGEAATLQFFSQAQYKNPMVVRIGSYGYQKGFGGHFHNDNSIAVLRDIPGLVIASPSRGDDAAAMLHTCAAAAHIDGTVSAFLEPIALYSARDLYDPGDGAWQSTYEPAAQHVPIGRARHWGSGDDLTLVSFANGVPMSLRAARSLEQEHGISCRLVDLRWLAPLPIDDILSAANATGRVLVVDETRRTGGVAEGVLAALIDHGYRGVCARVTSADCLVPLGDAAARVLLSQADVEAAAIALLRE